MGPMKNIILIGSSGHANVILEALISNTSYRVLGFTDSTKGRGVTRFGLNILGKIEELPDLIKHNEIHGGIVAIGDNWTRGTIVRQVNELAPDFEWINAIHPSAHLARNVSLGRGIVIMAGASIGPTSEIRDHCSIATNASLDHDSIMDTFSSLHPGVITGGNVRIGAFSAICLGANLIHGITIGRETVIGAGSTVLGDVPDNSIAYGTPARVIRRRASADAYL